MKRNGYVLISVLFIMILFLLSFGAFMKYSVSITTKEFHKDLAKIRGYWAVYGAKEIDSSATYPYYRVDSNVRLYDIEATKDGDKYSWKIVNDGNSGIKNDDIFKRTLEVESGTDKIKSYIYIP